MQGVRDRKELDLFWAALLSLVIHLVLLKWLPGISPPKPEAPPYLEVELIPPKPKSKPPAAPAPPASPQKTKTIKLSPLPKGLFSPPGADLKETHPLPAVGLPETKLPEKPLFLPLESLQPAPLEDVLKGAAKAPTPAPAPPQPAVASRPGSPLDIRWLGRPRKLVYQPPPPSYTSKVEGEVEVRFWVDGQGNVTNAVVSKKLDAKLELLAIDYLKRCRFEPLSIKDKQLDEGLARFIFKLE